MYFVLEIQKQHDGTCGHLVHAVATDAEAQSTYHTVLASAAQSTLACHSATLIADDGHVIRSEHYTHEPTQDP